MPWDDNIDWNPNDPLYTTDPVDLGNPFLPSPLPGDDFGSAAGTNGPGGDASGLGDTFDWGKVLDVLAKGGSAALSLGKQLGLVKSTGELDVMALLSLLTTAGMGAYQYNNVQGASEQLQNAAKSSMDRSTQMYNDAAALYKPYQAAGLSALEKMTAAGAQPLAAQFVAKGTPSNAAAQFRGAMSLADLAKRK